MQKKSLFGITKGTLKWKKEDRFDFRELKRSKPHKVLDFAGSFKEVDTSSIESVRKESRKQWEKRSARR